MDSIHDSINLECEQISEDIEAIHPASFRLTQCTRPYFENTRIESTPAMSESGNSPQCRREDHGCATSLHERQWSEDFHKSSRQNSVRRSEKNDRSCQGTMFQSEAQSWSLTKRVLVAGVICLYTYVQHLVLAIPHYKLTDVAALLFTRHQQYISSACQT